MISHEAVEYLQKNLQISGSEYLMSEAERKSGKFDYWNRLIDFKDDDIRIAANCNSVVNFLWRMEQKTVDSDVRAHIYGYKNHAEYIRDIELLQKELIEMGKDRT